MLSALTALLHHVAAFALVAALVAEHLLFDRRLEAPAMRTLRRVDAVYGASAGLLLAAGLLRVFLFEKGAHYYFGNPYFLAKLALFVVLALLSIYPTVAFISWRRKPGVTEAQARWIPRLLRAQLALVPLILLFAVLMARGFQ
jgi:putative membrane protein